MDLLMMGLAFWFGMRFLLWFFSFLSRQRRLRAAPAVDGAGAYWDARGDPSLDEEDLPGPAGGKQHCGTEDEDADTRISSHGQLFLLFSSGQGDAAAFGIIRAAVSRLRCCN
jgi:hypothetical protein